MFAAIKRTVKQIVERRHPLWPKARKAKLKKQPTCEACGGTADLEVHHDLPVSWPGGKAKELDEDNQTVLCGKQGCHLRIGHLGDYKSRNPNVKEDAAVWLRKYRERPYHDKPQPPQTNDVD